MDKLRALKYFKRLVELGSFTSVANEFDVPASSISRRIKDLETEVGVNLVKRSTRQVSVTELGELYYQKITTAINKLDEADSILNQNFNAPKGLVRISCSPSYGEKKVTEVIAEIIDQYPDILFDIHYTDDLVSLGRDPFDIAIRSGHPPNEHVMAKKLSNNEFILVCTPDFLKKNKLKKTMSAKDLEEIDAIQYRGPNGPIHWFAESPDGWKKLHLKPKFISNNNMAMRMAVLNGQGLALVPKWNAIDEINNGELLEIQPEVPISVAPGKEIGIYILYESSKYKIPRFKLSIDLLIDMLTE